MWLGITKHVSLRDVFAGVHTVLSLVALLHVFSDKTADIYPYFQTSFSLLTTLLGTNKYIQVSEEAGTMGGARTGREVPCEAIKIPVVFRLIHVAIILESKLERSVF